MTEWSVSQSDTFTSAERVLVIHWTNIWRVSGMLYVPCEMKRPCRFRGSNLGRLACSLVTTLMNYPNRMRYISIQIQQIKQRCLLGCNAVWSGSSSLTFRRNQLPSCSGLNCRTAISSTWAAIRAAVDLIIEVIRYQQRVNAYVARRRKLSKAFHWSCVEKEKVRGICHCCPHPRMSPANNSEDNIRISDTFTEYVLLL
jgi:hypothetical protein